jgi:uncharacterized membrane protein
MAQAKKLWESKTFWLAVLQIVVGILTALLEELTLGSTITLLGIIQIVLRTITKHPVKL